MGWRSLLILVLCFGLGLTGCRQHVFLTEADFQRARSLALATPAAPEATCPPTALTDAPIITTALNPAAQRRPIALAECVAISLENGRTGLYFGRRVSAQGVAPGGLTGVAPTSATDSIRVFAFEPARWGADIEESLAKFDARWLTSMTWNKIDEPSNPFVFNNTPFLPTNLDADRANFFSGLVKPLPTGGLAAASFRTDYDFSNTPTLYRPSYRPVLDFAFEQPLLQGAGVLINELRDRHPGGVQTPFPITGRVPGILLARISYHLSQAEFERQVQDLLFAVEEAYWQLYFAYWDLYARESALLQAHALWQIVRDRFEAGRIDAASMAQTEAQLQSFRADRLQALTRGRLGRLGVLEAERKLRYLLGLPPEDGFRLVPADTPTIAGLQPDWLCAVNEAMARRPELSQARQTLQAAHLGVLREADGLLPDIRFFANYNVNAIGSHLDGHDDNAALNNLSRNRFNDWGLGLRSDIPLGFREANAEVRKAKLRLAQATAYLQDQEGKVVLDLQRSYRDVIHLHKEIEYRRAQREQVAIQVRGRFETFVTGKPGVTLDVLASLLLEAQRNFADSLAEEHRAIYEYNVALADFERQKGSILEHDNVAILEGPVPYRAETRASAHIRERACSIPLIDSPGSSVLAPIHCIDGGCDPMLPPLPTGEPRPIPALLDRHRSMNELIETAPMPRPKNPEESP